MDPELAERIRQANQAIHDQEAPLYDQLHSEVSSWFQRRLIEQDIQLVTSLLPPGSRRAIDLGCGTGNLLLRLAAAGFPVSGVDISPAMVGEAIRRWQDGQSTDAAIAARTKAADQPGPPGYRRYRSCLRPPVPPEIMADDIDECLRRPGPSYHLISFGSVLHHLPDYLGTIRLAASRLATPGVIWIVNEPLAQEAVREGFISYRILYWVDQALSRLIMLRRGVRPLDRTSYDLSDFHRRQRTFDHREVVSLLTDLGFSLPRVRSFSLRKTGTVSWIDSCLLGSVNSFSLIAGRGLRGP